jgi:hypothetical protein
MAASQRIERACVAAGQLQPRLLPNVREPEACRGARKTLHPLNKVLAKFIIAVNLKE